MGTSDLAGMRAAQRLHMVNSQLKPHEVNDPAVIEAFLATPREAYVAPAFAGLAYLDQDIASAGAKTRRLLAPLNLARLLQAAEVSAGDRALDVGGGAGYTAALLVHMGARVVALETDPGAVAALREAFKTGVEIVEGDLAAGAPDLGPFDVIVINGAFEATPEKLLGQLAKRGRLVAIDARSGAARGVVIDKSAAGMSERSLFDAKADVLEGFKRAPSFAF